MAARAKSPDDLFIEAPPWRSVRRARSPHANRQETVALAHCAGRVALVAGLLFSTPGRAQSIDDYHGADAGWAVFAITIASAPMLSQTVHLSFRSVGDTASSRSVTYNPNGLFSVKNDVTEAWFDAATLAAIPAEEKYPPVHGTALTEVYVLRMPPGRYEIYAGSVDARVVNMGIEQRFKPTAPFTVIAGKTAYIGAFSFVPLGPGGFGGNTSRFALVRTDEHDRDLAAARRKAADLAATDPRLTDLPQTTTSRAIPN